MKALVPKPLLIILFFVSIVALCLPAFLNGYPIVNPDTNTYIESGFIPEVPMDRPIAYGILARLFSLNGISLWFVIVFQAILIIYIINISIRTTTGINNYVTTSITTILLALTSTVSWITSELIADVYTPIMLLSIACIALYPFNKKIPSGIYIIFFIAVLTHASHIAISLSLIFLSWLFRKQMYAHDVISKYTKRLLAMAVLSVSTYAINSSVFSKSSTAFLTASLINKGVLREYLDAKCGTEHYALCQYKDGIHTDSDDFLWSKESPLVKIGGWIGARDECRRMNNAVLLTYPYNLHFIQTSFVHAGSQLLHFNVGDGNTPLIDTGFIYASIKKFISNTEATNYLQSKQNTDKLLPIIDLINYVTTATIILSVIILMLCGIWAHHHLNKRLLVFILILVIGLLLNAAHCATFSILNGRFGCRVMWIIPFSSMLLLLSIWQKRKAINQ